MMRRSRGFAAMLAAALALGSSCRVAAADPGAGATSEAPVGTSGATTQPIGGPYGAPNLCGPRATDVLVGQVEEVNARLYTFPGNGGRQQSIRSRVLLRVESRVIGEAGRQGTVTFDVAGGTMNGMTVTSSGSPRFEVGERRLIFGSTIPPRDDEDSLTLMVAYRLPSPAELPALPAEQDLREVLAANCDANPSGIYKNTPLKQWIIPWSVVDRNVGTVFEQLWVGGKPDKQ